MDTKPKMKIDKIYKGHVDVRHDIVLDHIYRRKTLVLETPEGMMSLNAEQLSKPVILSDRTFPYQYKKGMIGEKYCLMSYPLKVNKTKEEQLKEDCQKFML